MSRTCVTYTRVSSKEQAEEGFSIPAQKKLLVEYARANDLRSVRDFSEVETAKAAGRIQFCRMIEFLQNNPSVKVVLAEKTDRLYRNFPDLVKLDELDLELHLVKENEVISKDSKSHAKLVHGIKVVLAKNYIDNLSEEVKKGMKEKAEQGEFPGKAPIGYLNDKATKTVAVDPKYARMIPRMFELYATGGYSLASLRDEMFAEGWRTVGGKKIGKSKMEAILKSPIYVGDFVWKDRLYRGKHEPLVSRELFEQVQALLRSGRSPRKGRKQFLLTGMLTCARCGCTIVAERKKGKYVYYHCTRAKGPCDHPYIREEDLDEQMASVMKAIEIDDQTVNDIIKALKDSANDERKFRETETIRLRRKLDNLQTRLDKAYEDRLDGIIDEGYWLDVSGRWRKEQDGLKDQLTRLTSANRDYVDEASEILELSKMAYSLYVSRSEKEKRQLLRSLLSNCLSDGVSLYPTYKKPFNMVAEGRETQIKLPRQDSNLRPAD